jgi:ubiquinone/menaquinone biosynthesis C-methylase UbiE
MRRRLEALPIGTVLDAACGTGRYADYLAARGHQVIGIDQSPEMIAIARARVPAGRFSTGDLSNIDLADASVDAVVCGLALVHVPDLDRALHEMARVVRPGGR